MSHDYVKNFGYGFLKFFYDHVRNMDDIYIIYIHIYVACRDDSNELVVYLFFFLLCILRSTPIYFNTKTGS